MNLPFSTQLNNRQTYFVEKILACLLEQKLAGMGNFIAQAHQSFLPKYEINRSVLATCAPKSHTIREDKNNRWWPGYKIHPFINNRSKQMLQFAPTIPCKGIQLIHVHKTTPKKWAVSIDRKKYASIRRNVPFEKQKEQYQKLTALALNDGFESIEQFFAYFSNGFKGKIIHWTNLKY